MKTRRKLQYGRSFHLKQKKKSLFSCSLSDHTGFPPVAVSQRVGRVWQSSAAFSLGATGSRSGVTAVGAGLLTHRAPGQLFIFSVPFFPTEPLPHKHTQSKHNVNLYIIHNVLVHNLHENLFVYLSCTIMFSPFRKRFSQPFFTIPVDIISNKL